LFALFPNDRPPGIWLADLDGFAHSNYFFAFSQFTASAKAPSARSGRRATPTLGGTTRDPESTEGTGSESGCKEVKVPKQREVLKMQTFGLGSSGVFGAAEEGAPATGKSAFSIQLEWHGISPLIL